MNTEKIAPPPPTRGRGRPTKYTAALDAAAKQYVIDYEKHGHPFPSVVGMAIVIGVIKSTLYRWAAAKRGDFCDTLANCVDFQEMIVLNGSIKNEFNSTISKLVLANFGYHDKQDSTHAGADGGPIQIEQITRTIVDPGPK